MLTKIMSPTSYLVSRRKQNRPQSLLLSSLLHDYSSQQIKTDVVRADSMYIDHRTLNNDNVSEAAKHEAEVKLHGLSKLKEGDQGHEGHGHA